MFIIIYIVSVLSGVAVAVFKHHTVPITSVEWHPSDSSVFAASGSDNQVTLLDLAVARDDQKPEESRKKWKFHHNYSSSTWYVTKMLLTQYQLLAAIRK